MSDVAIRMDHVYKMFRKGEVFNSLRDLIPALTGRIFRRQELSETDRREFWALQDLSFEVRRGEAFGIIGHNGAGKSTALKILSRIMKPTKGSMVVHGRLSALIEIAAGFHQDLTGRENIFLHGTILGMNRREIESKLDQIIAFSGIEEFIDTPVKRYSSGMYARLGFSVAAHVNPDVLIVDEVLSVGDYLFQQKCVERIKEVIQNGAAVVFVSHNLKTVAEFCHRCLLLERGRAITTGPAQDVIATYLKGSRTAHIEDAASKRVSISKVTVRNEHGECVRFQAGEKAWIDIEITARRPCHKLSVSFFLTDAGDSIVCGASTERLGCGSFNLEAGETCRRTFELTLNLVGGIFHVCALIFRYDIEKEFDRWPRAVTLLIESKLNVGGPANCFPTVVNREVIADETSNAKTAGAAGESSVRCPSERPDPRRNLPAVDN